MSQVKECEVGRDNLNDLPTIHELLSALNDPYAPSNLIADLVFRIPVLSARCLRRANSPVRQLRRDEVAKVLTKIGNRGLEAELLQLLEDLTTLKADLEG
ncbi:MAG: HDOD domain-containing protein [Polyangiaceae bacterium]|nr:HDOD domain-containing protein [Polyangiaceae bacterium]